RYSISTFRPAAQLASQADAAPFVGPAAGAALELPTCTGGTPAAVRSGRVYIRRGGWRAAVRSAPSRAARLRRSVLAGPKKFTLRSEATKGQRSRREKQGQQKCTCCRVVRSVGVSCTTSGREAVPLVSQAGINES